MNLMNGHKHNQEYTSLQAQPGIPVPYGVPQDAVEQITKVCAQCVPSLRPSVLPGVLPSVLPGVLTVLIFATVLTLS